MFLRLQDLIKLKAQIAAAVLLFPVSLSARHIIIPAQRRAGRQAGGHTAFIILLLFCIDFSAMEAEIN